MSEKKSKSKSKDKVADKPPKDKKQKKQKGDDAKSKKSLDKQSKKGNSSKKQGDKLSKSRVSKVSKGENQSKFDMDQSQNPSFFEPMLMNHLYTSDQSQCQYHKQKNVIFCQICQQPGCKQCLVYGPHNNQMHRVSKIDEAFNARYLYMNQLVCGQLIQRRERLNRRLQQLTVMSDQLRYLKNGVQKMTKIQYNQMLDRLRTSSGGKFAVLHHQMAELQKDLQAINALAHEFGYLTSMKPEISSIPPNNPTNGMVSFLLRSKYLQEQAEQLISKPIKTSVDVYPYDLPRQLTQKKKILDQNKKWIQLLQIKDQAIWTLVQQKKTVQKNLWNQFQQQAYSQVEQWTKLKQRFKNQLQGYQMSCLKCKTILHQDNINDQCTVQGYHEFN